MNDKLKNENVKNTNDNLEDLSSQEANLEIIEKKDEVESSSERKIPNIEFTNSDNGGATVEITWKPSDLVSKIN